MTTLLEHAKHLEEMKAAEKHVREWLGAMKYQGAIDRDIQLLLERIDAYEASITWQTDCLTCPKLYDQIYAMDQHTIPNLRLEVTKFRALLRRVLEDARISGADQVSDETRKDIRNALVEPHGNAASPQPPPPQPTGALLETEEQTRRFAENTYRWIADKGHCLDPDGLSGEIVQRLFEVFRGYIRHGQAVHAASVEKLNAVKP